MESSNIVCEISGLTVSYGRGCAVDNLSLKLERGKALALLGLNGAGKTSTIHCMLGLVKARSGEVRLFESLKRTPEILRRLGYVPEDVQLPDFLQAKEYLGFVSALKSGNTNWSEVDQLLSLFELNPKVLIRECSKGMIRRLVLGQAFLGPPELLILDEPLNGLDPILIMKLRDYLRDYRDKGGTLLYSSHILSEVEKTCNEVILLREGRIVYQNGITETVEQFGSVEKVFAEKLGNP